MRMVMNAKIGRLEHDYRIKEEELATANPRIASLVKSKQRLEDEVQEMKGEIDERTRIFRE